MFYPINCAMKILCYHDNVFWVHSLYIYNYVTYAISRSIHYNAPNLCRLIINVLNKYISNMFLPKYVL